MTNIKKEFENHPNYCKGEDRRKWDKEFGIRHYAGTVVYSVSGFVDKNRDSQQDVFFDLLGKSKSPFVQQLVEYRDLLSKVAQLGTDSRYVRVLDKISLFTLYHYIPEANHLESCGTTFLPD